MTLAMLWLALGCDGGGGLDAGPTAMDAGPGDAGADAAYVPPDAGPPGASLDPELSCDDVAAELDCVLRAAVAIGFYAEMTQVSSDPADLAAMFAAPVRDQVLEAVETGCFGDVVGALDTAEAGYVPPATLGELVDETFRTAVLACADEGTCPEPIGAFVARDRASEPRLDASAPPILFVASQDDEASTPGIVGCAIDRVRRDVEVGSAHAIAWALAVRSGDAPPPCPGSTGAPRCMFP